MGSKGAEPPSHTNCLTYGPSRRSAYGPPRRYAHGVKGCTTHNSQPFPAPTVRPRTQPTIRSRTLSHAQKSAKDTQTITNSPSKDPTDDPLRTLSHVSIHGSSTIACHLTCVFKPRAFHTKFYFIRQPTPLSRLTHPRATTLPLTRGYLFMTNIVERVC